MTTLEYYQSLTKRQLLKQTRQAFAHHADVKECRDKGSNYYLGDNITGVLARARMDCRVSKAVLLKEHNLSANQLKEINSLNYTY